MTRDPLAPARGTLNGCLLSLLPWLVILVLVGALMGWWLR